MELKLSHHLHSDRNFRNFLVNGEQPGLPAEQRYNNELNKIETQDNNKCDVQCRPIINLDGLSPFVH